MLNTNATAKKLRPERVLSAWDNVSMVELVQQLEDGTKRVAGYCVYEAGDESRVMHKTLEAAETDFLRRTWR